MCIVPKMPTPKKPPPPVNKIDSMTSSLRNMQARKAGAMAQSDTNVTGGLAGSVPTYTPAAGNKSILGG